MAVLTSASSATGASSRGRLTGCRGAARPRPPRPAIAASASFAGTLRARFRRPDGDASFAASAAGALPSAAVASARGDAGRVLSSAADGPSSGAGDASSVVSLASVAVPSLVGRSFDAATSCSRVAAASSGVSSAVLETVAVADVSGAVAAGALRSIGLGAGLVLSCWVPDVARSALGFSKFITEGPMPVKPSSATVVSASGGVSAPGLSRFSVVFSWGDAFSGLLRAAADPLRGVLVGPAAVL